MTVEEKIKLQISLEQINSKLAFCRQSLKLLLDEGEKLAGEELQGLFEILCEAQKAIDCILPQINPD